MPSLRPIVVAMSLALAAPLAAPAFAQDDPALAPYVMMRSLQFVQDTVALGDHSAGEMQRFMLGRIDQAFRSAPSSVFDDPRNVDAALIYAMSGGNPATLEYLAGRDIAGNFDSRVADALRKYLNGQGTLVAKALGDMANEYRDEPIGSYLALVSGNVALQKNPKGALEFFDLARLGAPGTIVEEAALRRSVAIAVDADMVDKGLAYSRKYARRFVHSPYASQFVDFFVQLVVEHYPQVAEHDIDGTVEFMDAERRKEVFLRIARRAALEGKNELARFASDRATALSGELPASLARLYGGLASIPTSGVDGALKDLLNIPEEQLSLRDRALRDAAQAVAAEVLRQPVAESLAQDAALTMAPTPDAATPNALPGDDTPGSAADSNVVSDSSAAKLDPELQTFVDSGRSKLSAIDELLKEEGVRR
jgi:chemotaxis protein MotC